MVLDNTKALESTPAGLGRSLQRQAAKEVRSACSWRNVSVGDGVGDPSHVSCVGLVRAGSPIPRFLCRFGTGRETRPTCGGEVRRLGLESEALIGGDASLEKLSLAVWEFN